MGVFNDGEGDSIVSIGELVDSFPECSLVIARLCVMESNG